MRSMSIPPFENCPEITDLSEFYKARLACGLSAAGPIGVQLLGYMGWPNDASARELAVASIEQWLQRGESGPLPPKLRTIQQHWARFADIVELHYDMACGNHLESRGGASTGKAIYLTSKVARSKGTGIARLWTVWKSYKDVGSVVAAVAIICADIKQRHKQTGLGIGLQQMLPFRTTLLMPELVIALGLTIEQYGLQSDDGQIPLFNPEMLWRIPAGIGIAPLPMPERQLRPEDLSMLRARRAGNRGKPAGVKREGGKPENVTTPIL